MLVDIFASVGLSSFFGRLSGPGPCCDGAFASISAAAYDIQEAFVLHYLCTSDNIQECKSIINPRCSSSQRETWRWGEMFNVLFASSDEGTSCNHVVLLGMLLRFLLEMTCVRRYENMLEWRPSQPMHCILKELIFDVWLLNVFFLLTRHRLLCDWTFHCRLRRLFRDGT